MIDNRITRYGEENPEDLLANPFNFRLHPAYQQEAVADVLDEVGWVKHILVNEVTSHIVDGHLRVMEAIKRGERFVPVAYVSLTEKEEAEILATLDPIKSLAKKNDQNAQALADRVQARSNSLKLMVESLRPPQTPQADEKQESIQRERPENPNGIFSIGEFRFIVPLETLNAWWSELLERHGGNQQKAALDILASIGVDLEAGNEQPAE